MSTGQFLNGAANENPQVSDHDPDDDCNSRVYVNGTRIPVANANIHIRKEGALDVTRYAEVQFPAEYNGNPYQELFSTHRPDSQTDFDTLYIELKTGSGEFVPVFRGFVTGVGATDKSLIWQCRARGPADMLTSATVGKQFTNSSIDKPLQYIANRLDGKLPFRVDVELSTEATEDVGVEQEASGGDRALAARLNAQNIDFDTEISAKTFQSNRHTVKDVADWIRSKSPLQLWFEPTENGVTLVPFDNPTSRSFKAHYLDGDIQVISNDAYAELAPVNTMKAKGSASKSVGSNGFLEQFIGAEKYYIAEARHKALYQRAGETELEADTWIRSDGTTKNEVSEDARKALKDAVDEATEGDMLTLLSGEVIPYDTITARPTCRSEAEKTVPLTYEVHRVEHMINPDEGESRSRINVGIHTDLQDDIEILDTWTAKKNKGGGG